MLGNYKYRECQSCCECKLLSTQRLTVHRSSPEISLYTEANVNDDALVKKLEREDRAEKLLNA